MKVCDATQFYSAKGGGVKRYLMEKRKYIVEHTDDEHVLLVPGPRTERIQEGRLITWTVASPPIDPTSKYRLMFDMRQAADIIYKEKPDIIESGDPYQLGWRMHEVAQHLGIPIVGFYHSHFPEAYLRTVLKYCGPWLRDVVMEYAQDYIVRFYGAHDATLVPSKFLAELLGSWGVHNATPVRLGVDTNIFNPEGPLRFSKAELGFREDSILLLYVGRLVGEKNTLTMLKAFEELHEREPGKYSFMIVGDGPLRVAVKRLEQKVGCLRWRSYCADSFELKGYYQAADLFVHPGVCETFGLVTMESQACGVPVVGIRGSYMDSNIFAGLENWATANTGYELANAIERMSVCDLPSLGLQASSVVQEEFNWPKVCSIIWDAYHRAIEQIEEEKRFGAALHF